MTTKHQINNMETSKRVLILTAGHSLFEAGAWRQWFDEAKETIDLRDRITAELKKTYGIEATNDSNHERTGTVIKWVNEVYSEDDLLIEIHFNAVDNLYASGTEAYVQHAATEYEKTTAASLCEVSAKVLGIANRGVKTPAFSQHSKIGIIDRTKSQSVLFEVCFMSNPDEIITYRKKRANLAKSIAAAINKALKS